MTAADFNTVIWIAIHVVWKRETDIKYINNCCNTFLLSSSGLCSFAQIKQNDQIWTILLKFCFDSFMWMHALLFWTISLHRSDQAAGRKKNVLLNETILNFFFPHCFCTTLNIFNVHPRIWSQWFMWLCYTTKSWVFINWDCSFTNNSWRLEFVLWTEMMLSTKI